MAFAKSQNVGAAHFTAIGAFSDVTLGYFGRAAKDYTKIPLREQVESPRHLRKRYDPETGLALIDPSA